MALIFAFIPEPPDWATTYRLYGIMIAIGVIVGLELARRRWANRGGDPDDMSTIALWAVPSGLVGARVYHLITSNELYADHWFDAPWSDKSPFAIWRGGLGIPGGIIAGVLVGVWMARRLGLRVQPSLDAVAPCLALAQAIGRWGNYFNQELFGGPTTLPWGLEVNPEISQKLGLEDFQTFHPTFLYEMLWNLGLVVVLLLIDRKRVLRPGRVFALYIGGYFLGRLWVEALRVDPANTILGLRVNTWTSLIAIGGVIVFLVVGGVRRRPGDSDEPYVDGHRFDDPTGDADDLSETDDVGGPNDSDRPSGEYGPDRPGGGGLTGGTRARSAAQRAGGGDDANPSGVA
jgi:prolipoprotein diacylglyceryl transferase